MPVAQSSAPNRISETPERWRRSFVSGRKTGAEHRGGLLRDDAGAHQSYCRIGAAFATANPAELSRTFASADWRR